MTKKAHFVRVIVDKQELLCELKTIDANSLNIEKQPCCPCCHETMPCVFEIIQWGFIEDKNTLLLVCASCEKAYWYSYTLSLLELTPDGESEAHHAN